MKIIQKTNANKTNTYEDHTQTYANNINIYEKSYNNI